MTRRLRRPVAKEAEDLAPATVRRLRRTRQAAAPKSLNVAALKELEANVDILNKIEETIATVASQKKKAEAELKRIFTEVYGDDVGEAKPVANYFLGYTNTQSRATTEIPVKEYQAKLKEAYPDKGDGERIFLESVSITKTAAQNYLTNAAIDAISVETKKAKSKKEFVIKRSKAKIS